MARPPVMRRALQLGSFFLLLGRYLRIAADGRLTVEIRDAAGAVVPDDRGRPGALTLPPAR